MKSSNFACCCRKFCAAGLGFFLQRQMHALVAAILLGMTGLDALDVDTKPQPPNGDLRFRQYLRRSLAQGSSALGR